VKISALLKEAVNQFKDAGISSPVLDAEIILSHALNINRYEIIVKQNNNISNGGVKRAGRLIKRRLNFEPVAYITGKKEFYSLEFMVNKNVLIPRPETELLVDLVLYYAEEGDWFLDLGTGSGAVAVSVKYNRPELNVFASDISGKALGVAKNNMKKILGKPSIDFFKGDIFEPFKNHRFNIIVFNPPYIDKELADSVQKELKHEPEIALFSGNKGREIIERAILEVKDYLHESGCFIMEIDSSMKDFIKSNGIKNGFSVSVFNDYADLPRAAVMTVV